MKRKRVYRTEASLIFFIAMKRLELLIPKESDPKSNAVTISPHYSTLCYIFIFGLEPKALKKRKILNLLRLPFRQMKRVVQRKESNL